MKKKNIKGLLIFIVAVLLVTFKTKANVVSDECNIDKYRSKIVENTEFTEESALSNFTDNNESNCETGYIFIGDSRFVGMNDACGISNTDNRFVIAMIGEGYDFLVNTALQRADEITTENSDITNWKYIICLGVNDLYNIDKYISEYNKLKTTVDLVIVSVNPIEYHSSITNDDIDEFNNRIKDIGDVQYIDTNYTLCKEGFSTVDGIHYTSDTYKLIYNTINTNLEKNF